MSTPCGRRCGQRLHNRRPHCGKRGASCGPDVGPARYGGPVAARHPEQLALGIRVEVEVRRSARRRRTVSAYRDGDRIVVLIPGRFTRAEEAEWVAKMVARLDSNTRPTG